MLASKVLRNVTGMAKPVAYREVRRSAAANGGRKSESLALKEAKSTVYIVFTWGTAMSAFLGWPFMIKYFNCGRL
ncbi:HBR028Wp [Eremothecium sinecaudum]|uniref:HBR028Wp n=1 Tax=Eremothecium sinecaudum TaxID=45286 RepID=A0A120K120_9SACH|nr:HBR028Wp [Eremothecium sinecaudum]AMD18929.1 HBR028Wp [Eremothecium sinecaudum]